MNILRPLPMAIFLLAAILVGGCATPAPEVSFSKPEDHLSSIPEPLKRPPANRRTVAFVGMRNKSIYAADNLWDIASHLLTTRLVEIGYFSVVEWDRMKRDFDPVHLKNASLVSTPDQFMDTRNRLDCDLFLGGAITYYDVSQSGAVSAISKNKTMTTTVRVDLWLQDARTGEFVSAASGSGRAVQQFTGGLLGGNIGTWDINVANRALGIAIDDALIKTLTLYDRRKDRAHAQTARRDGHDGRMPPGPAVSPPGPGMPPHPAPPPTEPDAFPGIAQPDRSIPVQDMSAFRRTSSKWALVVGVGNFMDTRISPLDYTERDAMAMHRYLVDPRQGNFPPDQVFLLIGDRATTFNVKFALDIISKHARPDDLVVLFISSHGTPGEMDVEEVGYLATYDTLVDSLYATAFNMTELASAVNHRIKAKAVVTLADACYSAGSLKDVQFLRVRGAKDLIVETGFAGIPGDKAQAAFRSEGFGISDDLVEQLSSGTGRVFIASSRVDEQSWESDRLGHGFFTYYLLEALTRGETGGSIQKAFDYIERTIPAEVMREKGAPQNPVMGLRMVEGDIRLDVPPRP